MSAGAHLLLDHRPDDPAVCTSGVDVSPRHSNHCGCLCFPLSLLQYAHLVISSPSKSTTGLATLIFSTIFEDETEESATARASSSNVLLSAVVSVDVLARAATGDRVTGAEKRLAAKHKRSTAKLGTVQIGGDASWR